MKRYYDHYQNQRNTRKHWKSSGIGNAFRFNLGMMRREALKLYYEICEKVQRQIFAIAEIPYEPDSSKKIKAQLSICFTNYPANLAAWASIGQTAWVQYKELTKSAGLTLYKKELEAYVLDKHIQTDAEALNKLLDVISGTITERLVYEELKKRGLESEIESFRIFLASSSLLEFISLPGIIKAVILFGDLLPDESLVPINPFSQILVKVVTSASAPYQNRLVDAKPDDLLNIGIQWVKHLMHELHMFLPGNTPRSQLNKNHFKNIMGYSKYIHSAPKSASEELPGFNDFASRPPMFEDLDTEVILNNELSGRKGNEIIKKSAGTAPELPEDVKKFNQEITEFANSIKTASGQSSYEDIRSDIIVQGLMKNSFSPGPVQGSAFEGSNIKLDLGGDIGNIEASIYDQPLELSFNQAEVEKLRQDSQPLVNAMRRNIYPSTEETIEIDIIKNSGSFSQRLPHYRFSDTIYKRYSYNLQLNKNGNASVLIVCDGSGSMNHEKTKLLKILTASWIQSTLSTRIQLLAGIYNNGGTGNGRYGPIVKWVVHPVKTQAISKNDYIRAVASVPAQGGGGQEDALALSYCIQETLKCAGTKNRMIYLTHLSDTQWCNSFSKGLTAEDELVNVIKHFQDKLKGKLHYTLVGLGTDRGGKVEKLADKSIFLNAAELATPYICASKIGLYVSSCLKERNRKVSI
jgi:hypothetical protein